MNTPMEIPQTELTDFKEVPYEIEGKDLVHRSDVVFKFGLYSG